MEYQIWLNGDYVPRNKATLSFKDRGFRLSDVVFDVSRTFDGKIFRLRDHLERLYRSLQYIRIDPGISIESMEELTLEVARRNEPLRDSGDDYYVTHVITRGPGIRVTTATEHTVAIWIDPLGWSLFAPLYESGAHVVIPKTRAYSPEQVDPKIKHYNRLNFVLAELEATDVDPSAFALLLDQAGNLTEAVNLGNVFVVTKGIVRTPTDRSVLQGVSRATALELAKGLGIQVSEEDLQPYDLYTADEAFATSSTHCVCPIGRADNRTIGTGVPGPVTRQLLTAWSKLVGLDIVAQIQEQAKRPVARHGVVALQ